MTNIFLQAPNNSRITWERLENYCRVLIEEGKELYINSGTYAR
jgi:endonuclease G, mitochondrial